MDQEYTNLLYEDARKYLDSLDPDVIIRLAQTERLKQRQAETHILDGGSAHE